MDAKGKKRRENPGRVRGSTSIAMLGFLPVVHSVYDDWAWRRGERVPVEWSFRGDGVAEVGWGCEQDVSWEGETCECWCWRSCRVLFCFLYTLR